MTQLLSQDKIKYFKKTFSYLKRYKKLSSFIILFALLSSVFESFGIGTVIPLFQGILSFQKGTDLDIPYREQLYTILQNQSFATVIIFLIIFFFLMIVLKNIFNYLNLISVSKITNFIKRDLQIDLFDKIVDAHLRFFSDMRSGHIISSISVYTNNVASFIFSFFSSFLVIIRLLIYAVILMLISWKFTLILASIAIILLPLLKFVFVRIKKLGLHIAEEVSTLYFRMTEMFSMVNLMKIFSTEEYEKERFQRVSSELARFDFLGSVYSNILRPLAEIIVTGVIFAFLIYMLLVLKLDLSIYLASALVYLYVFLQFFTQTNNLLSLVAAMYSHIEAFKAYEKIFIRAYDSQEINGSIAINFLKKSIEFKDIFFSYDEAPILSNLNFSIERETFVAFVGPTGVGKTTIVNLVGGLFTPTKGAIMIDGIDLKKMDLHAWRRNLGYVSQDVSIFNDTVKNNIKYGKFDSTDDHVIQAAKVARIHDFVMSLPQAYDTILGERGVKLSGGQRQRISIARALVHDPSILILDEATSSLDNETEKLIQEALAEATKKRTVIAIAHRLSTIKNADKIFVLNEGRIVEQGTHEELIKNSHFYKHYYNLQFSK
ncbi:MAG: ABC transporter ATP-binding protein [Candidatus Magasanikbacteria bacterium]